MKRLIILALLFASLAFSQALQAPVLNVQFFNNTGQPLAGGYVYVCAAGSISCPGGTPLPTYNSSAGSTQNQNPIRLDGGGRASIWLTQGVGYKFVVTTSTGQVIPGEGGDNIFGAITQLPSTLSPTGPTNSVQLNGGSNTLLGTPNLVFNPTTQTLGLAGIVGQASLQSVSGYIQSFGGFLSTFSNGGIWNGFNSPTDGAFLRGYTVSQTTANTAGGYIEIQPITYNPYNGSTCTDSFGNNVQQPLPLNGLANFGANDALLWVGNSPSMPSGGSCGSPLPVPTNIGLNTNAWVYARGGLITDNPQYNAITALFGGAYVKLGVTVDQALYPKAYAAAGSLNTPGAGYGGLAYQGGSIYYYFNRTTGVWNTVDLSATGGGGTGCVLGATSTGQVLFNLSNVCTSSANLTWNNSTQQMGITSTANTVAALTVSTGYVASSGGFNTLACAAANCLNVADGGIQVGLGILAGQLTSAPTGTAGAFYPMGYATTAALATPPTGAGGFSYAGASVGTGATYYYYNAATPGWASVNFATTGSGCTLGGTATGQILFNLSSACTSSANLTWNNATGQMGIVTGADTTAALTVGPGYVSATGGFNSLTCVASTCLQAPNGGMTAALGFTTNQGVYFKGYSSSASLNAPAATYGAIAYTGAGLNYWAWNATTSTWNSITLGTGGGGGSVAGPANAVQYNSNPAGTQSGDGNFTWDPAGHVLNVQGSYNLLGAPSINGSNQFVGSGVNVTGAVQSQSAPAAIAFQTAGSSFTVLGNGSVTATGPIQSTNSVNVTVCSLANCIQSSGGISSSASGASIGFQLANSLFNVVGNGIVNAQIYQANGPSGAFNVLADTAFNSFQTTGGIALRTGGFSVNAITSNGQALVDNANNFVGANISLASGGQYKIAGSTVINSTSQFIGTGGINTPGNATVAALTATSGSFSSGIVTGNSASNSTLITGSGGNFYDRPLSTASTSVSCSGVSSGWMAISSDDFVVVCIGGARFRAALVSF